MKEIDIYDWDKTCVPFDCSKEFAIYCIKHKPWLAVYAPVQAIGYFLLRFKIISYDRFRELFFSFVRHINTEKEVKKFWDEKQSFVFDWFKPENRVRESVILSSSPSFLLSEIANRLEVEYLICSEHNSKNGKLNGKSCAGNEKVRLFKEKFKDFVVVDVYSDSISSDKVVFDLATGTKYNTLNGELIKI